MVHGVLQHPFERCNVVAVQDGGEVLGLQKKGQSNIHKSAARVVPPMPPKATTCGSVGPGGEENDGAQSSENKV